MAHRKIAATPLTSAEQASREVFDRLLHELEWLPLPFLPEASRVKPKPAQPTKSKKKKTKEKEQNEDLPDEKPYDPTLLDTEPAPERPALGSVLQQFMPLKALLRSKEFPPTGKSQRMEWRLNPNAPDMYNLYYGWPGLRRARGTPELMDPEPPRFPGILTHPHPGLLTHRLQELIRHPLQHLPTTDPEVAAERDKRWRAILRMQRPTGRTLRQGTCSLCDRESSQLTKHHLLPKEYVQGQFMTERERHNAFVKVCWLCWPCHGVVHNNISNHDLGAHYNTPEMLKCHPLNAEWLAWSKQHTEEELCHIMVRSYANLRRQDFAGPSKIDWALEQIWASRDFPPVNIHADRPQALAAHVSGYLDDTPVGFTGLRLVLGERKQWERWYQLVYADPGSSPPEELDAFYAATKLLDDSGQPVEDVSSHLTAQEETSHLAEAEEPSHFVETEADFHFAEAEETYYFAEAKKRPHLMRAERTPFFAEVQEIYRLAGMEEPTATAGA